MRLLVDADGVLFDWDAEYDSRMDAYGPEAAGITRSRDRRVFNLLEGMNERQAEIIEEVCAAPGYYRNMPLIPGAQEAIARMVAWGHEVFIVSTPWFGNPTCADDKIHAIAEHFGADIAKRTILTHDKTLIMGDFLIDDKWLIKGVAKPTWQHVRFGAGYREPTEAPFTLEDWEHLELQPWWTHGELVPRPASIL